LSRETIGGKTRDQWDLYMLRVKHLAQVMDECVGEAHDKGDEYAAEEIYKLFDALLNVIVLAEFVIDHHDWKEKKKNIQ
jgi:hypothetical protein